MVGSLAWGQLRAVEGGQVTLSGEGMLKFGRVKGKPHCPFYLSPSHAQRTPTRDTVGPTSWKGARRRIQHCQSLPYPLEEYAIPVLSRAACHRSNLSFTCARPRVSRPWCQGSDR